MLIVAVTHLVLMFCWFLGTAEPPVDVWGFHPHKLINRQAIFTLPPPMIGFFKHHIHYISERAVAADQRRYAVSDEGPRHYIDLDYYGLDVPRNWEVLVNTFHRDSIMEHGILPWHLQVVRAELVQAFKDKEIEKILKISADAGHYLADAHVPLHTTSNYNGQKTGQQGIHGFWETRIPELLVHEFDLWTGKASYQYHWYDNLWQVILTSHMGVDSVLVMERELTMLMPEDQKYSYEVRLSKVTRVNGIKFSKAYHRVLNKQVEKRMRAAIQSVGDFWYTCWIDAGQPDLTAYWERNENYSSDYQYVADSIWRNHHLMRSMD
jgi:hypothetical protein